MDKHTLTSFMVMKASDTGWIIYEGPPDKHSYAAQLAALSTFEEVIGWLREHVDADGEKTRGVVAEHRVAAALERCKPKDRLHGGEISMEVPDTLEGVIAPEKATLRGGESTEYKRYTGSDHLSLANDPANLTNKFQGW